MDHVCSNARIANTPLSAATDSNPLVIQKSESGEKPVYGIPGCINFYSINT